VDATRLNIAGRPLEEWNDAYARVEGYFCSLRIRNKLLLSQLVNRVLACATARAEKERDKAPVELAYEETDRLITEWFAEILGDDPTGTDQRISVKGRLSLLLADMSGQWQEQFLQAGPWPEEFVTSMRETYPRSGPDFQLSQMSPRPIDLGPIKALTAPGRRPYLLMVLVWGAAVALLVFLFRLTHVFAQ
jgi:hypothetical protein